jgi:hypothetical protein
MLAAAGTTAAQERTGTIHGRVVDSSGGVLIGATVTLTDVLTGTRRELLTNDEGSYSAPKLPTGTYTVEAQLAGFKKFQRPNVVLGAGAVAEIDVTLTVGDSSETVEVTAAAPMVNTSSGAMRTSIDSVFVERIPLNGRDANALILLAPGITSGVKGYYAGNGVRETSNNFTLDGIDNSDIYQGSTSFSPPPDALKEFTVQTNYSSEYGRGGGIAVTAITRSGTNQLHASVYDYFRSENLNANTFDRNSRRLVKPDFKQHQWGFTVGGPARLPGLYDGRNKTFFFFGIQRLGSPGVPTLYRRGGLTAAELSGDFSQSAVIPTVSKTAEAQKNSPFAGMAGARITDLRPYLSQSALNWYKLFNLPTVEKSGTFFFEDRSYALHRPDYTLRMDHNISTKNNLSFSMFLRADRPALRQIDYAPVGFLQGNSQTNKHFTLGDVWTISPTLLNEVLVGYNRIIFNTEATTTVPYDQLGFAFNKASERQLVSVKNISPSLFNIAPGNFKGEWRDFYDFRDTISWNKGNHLLKAGVMVQWHNATQVLTQNFEYQFNGGILGNSAAEFLIGWPGSVSIAQEGQRAGRRNVSHAFIQDDWKVSPRLTLNLGLRWEPMRWGYLKGDNSLLFVPGVQSTHFPLLPVGTIWIAEPPSPSRSGREDEWNNFAPRLGVAYRLDGAGKSVVRAGWGIFYDSIPAVHETVDLNSEFPFIYSFGTDFQKGYPGKEGWLNPFAYEGVAIPNLALQPDPTKAALPNPRSRPGQYKPPISLGYVHQFNATFEREIKPGWTASAAYSGSRGVDLWGLDYWNVPVPRDSKDSWDRDNLDSRRPIRDYSVVDKSFPANNGKTSYNSFVLTMRASTSRLHLLSHYTYSRAYGNIDGVHSSKDAVGYGRSNPFNLDSDWALSVMDVPHRLVVASSYDLPMFGLRNNWAGKILGHWAVTPVLDIQNGRRVNALAPTNNTFSCQNCWARPDLTGQPIINANWRSDPNLVYVNAAAFKQPADGAYGNAPRNVVRWPYTKNLDLSLSKTFPLYGEKARFELKMDAFNLFNWVNFKPPDVVLPGKTPSTLGMYGAGFLAPRTLQVGGRIYF